MIVIGVEANGCNWAEGGLSAFGSTGTQSGLSGCDPKADIGTKRISLRKLHELSMREYTHLHTCFVMQGKAVDNIGASLIIPDNFYVASITP